MYCNAILSWANIAVFFVSKQVIKQTFSFIHFLHFLEHFFFMLMPTFLRYGKLTRIVFLSSISFSNFFGDGFTHFIMKLLGNEKKSIPWYKHFYLDKLKTWTWWNNLLCSLIKKMFSQKFPIKLFAMLILYF